MKMPEELKERRQALKLRQKDLADELNRHAVEAMGLLRSRGDTLIRLYITCFMARQRLVDSIARLRAGFPRV